MSHFHPPFLQLGIQQTHLKPVRTNSFQFPYQLRLQIAPWSAMTWFASLSQLCPEGVLWSVREVHCGLEEMDNLHVSWIAGRIRASLKTNREFSTYMASSEWWVTQARGTKVTTLPSCHKTEILVFHEAIHEGFLRTFTIKKFFGKLPLLKYYNYFPYLGKTIGLRHHQQTSRRGLVYQIAFQP